jgi:TctA family transporter
MKFTQAFVEILSVGALMAFAAPSHDGIGLLGVAMGMFRISEIVANLGIKERREVSAKHVGHLKPLLSASFNCHI